jgi:flagellar basal-body rod protein FlgG
VTGPRHDAIAVDFETGMEAQQTQLDTISNNLANVSTNGYKRSHAVFEDLMYQNMRQAGAASSDQTELPTGLQVGLGTRAVATARNFGQGNLLQSSNPLDVAIRGNGFFQIQLPDGTTGYTRDGSFQVSSTGQLVTNNGYTVQPGSRSAGGAERHDRQRRHGERDPSGQALPQSVGQIQLANFVRSRRPRAEGRTSTARPLPRGRRTPASQGSTAWHRAAGFVSSSNVNVVEELVQMIQTQRAYELNSKAIQTSDQMLQKLAQL